MYILKLTTNLKYNIRAHKTTNLLENTKKYFLRKMYLYNRFSVTILTSIRVFSAIIGNITHSITK